MAPYSLLPVPRQWLSIVLSVIVPFLPTIQPSSPLPLPAPGCRWEGGGLHHLLEILSVHGTR
jgi:hypothetical protein